MNTISTSLPSVVKLNADERSKAQNYLVATRDSLVEAVDNLSESQWNFKPSCNDWSIAEILEHMVLIEDRVHSIIARMPDAPPAEPNRLDWQLEEIILTQMPKRSTKVTAPPHVLPLHRWTPAECLVLFLESRSRTLKLLVDAPALRGHVIPHPVLGPWDGYQWILSASAHSARHTGQILEVKASPGFPGSFV